MQHFQADIAVLFKPFQVQHSTSEATNHVRHYYYYLADDVQAVTNCIQHVDMIYKKKDAWTVPSNSAMCVDRKERDIYVRGIKYSFTSRPIEYEMFC